MMLITPAATSPPNGCVTQQTEGPQTSNFQRMKIC